MLISHTSKVLLKILQARLQQYVNLELPDVQAGFRKGREGGSGWGTRVHPWQIHADVRQKPIQYHKVITLQLK